MTSIIKCRKCGGHHFTVKCNTNEVKEVPSINKQQHNSINHISDSQSLNLNQHYKNKYITYRVKISELPNDLTENEIMKQLYDWGDIVKLKVLNHNDMSIVYIDFRYEKQADYFVKALHKTNYDHNIISVCRI
jgi:hypothetical protein